MGAAESTTLSVDGPGLYGAYGLAGEATIYFTCSGAPNTDQIHTYTLRTIGGGPVAAKTLTVKARINEIPQV